MNNQFPPFAVGQKVVALRSCRNDFGMELIKGKVYTVLGIIGCHCGEWNVNIGIFTPPGGISTCAECGIKISPIAAYVPYEWLAPIIEGMQAITFEKIVDQEPVSVN
jgi:hypothetical protein